MQNVLSLWSALDPRRRIVVALATVAVFAVVLGLARMAARPDLSLLYAGLDPAAAGDVLAALDQSGTPHEVRGTSIFVPAADRDALRLTLAGQGLPANSAAGYELLDSLSGFGTTAQMFDAAYWRAKEGELARTILAAPGIRQARVHIAAPSSSFLQRDAAPSASVTVIGTSGAIPAQRATALRYLVASAVAGLTPDAVSVIDGQTGAVVSGDQAADTQGADARAALLRANILRLLEARVGPGNAVVEVSLETVTESEAITERVIDPDSRIAISTETTERATASTETGRGAVTVASNLPDGDAARDGGAAQSEDSETRETVNYEVSETRREVVRAPGAVRRLSVAVLIDGLRVPDPDSGQPVWQPRPEPELDALRALVAAAAGIDAARGDELTLRSMEFRPLDLPDIEDASWMPPLAPLDPMRLVQLAVLAVVALVLGLFVVRPVLAGRAAARPAPALAGPGVIAMGHAAADGTAALPAPARPIPLAGEADAADVQAARAGSAEANDAVQPVPPDPVERLRLLIAERRDESVEILRSWLDEPEEHV